MPEIYLEARWFISGSTSQCWKQMSIPTWHIAEQRISSAPIKPARVWLWLLWVASLRSWCLSLWVPPLAFSVDLKPSSLVITALYDGDPGRQQDVSNHEDTWWWHWRSGGTGGFVIQIRDEPVEWRCWVVVVSSWSRTVCFLSPCRTLLFVWHFDLF